MTNKFNLNLKQCFNNFINNESKLFNFLRFGTIGVINTIHYYIWYILLLWLKVPYIISHTVSFTFSMIGSYFLNCYFTFKVKPTFAKFVKFPLTTLTNYIVSTFSLILLVNMFHISPKLAALLASILPIPITFTVTHYILKPSHTNTNVSKNYSKFFRNLFVFIFLLSFSIGCHLYIFYKGVLFGTSGTDNTMQFMYFVPFIQKALTSGQHLWSWSYGLGGDILGGFSYYYSTSPFFYLLLLIREIGFGSLTLASTLNWRLLLSIFKQLLSMLILYYLLRYEGRKVYSSIIGALIYGGCISFIHFSLFFDFMADAYIWLPLTILGWRIYNKTGKYFLFVISAALTIANNFYFGFISFVFYVIFIIVFMKLKGSTLSQKIHSFFKEILKYSMFTILALGIAAAAFIPSVITFLNTDRFSTKFYVPIFYNMNTMLEQPSRLFSYYSILGFPLIVLIILILPWKKFSWVTKRKTILALIFFILYLTPLSGSFFNGFSYSSDRWFYLFIFSVAYAVPDWLDENDRLKSVNLYRFLAISALILILFNVKVPAGSNFTAISPSKTKLIHIMTLILGLTSFLTITLKKYTLKRSSNLILNFTTVCCAAAALVINSNAYLYIAKPDMNYSILQRSGMDNKEERQIFENLTPLSDEFYRVIFRNLSEENSPMSYGYYGASAYNSMIDGNLHKWLKVDLNILNRTVTPSTYANFDDRLFLETFFGCKYMVKSKDDNYVPPYGYTLIKKTDNYSIYKNNNNAGFDLWYTNIIDKQVYDKMNIAQKDASLLQAAAVDQNVIRSDGNIPNINNVTTELKPDLKNAVAKNLKLKNGIITAGENASISIPINNQRSDAGEILFSMNLKPVNGQQIILNVNDKSTKKMEENYPYVYPLNTFTFKLPGDTKVLNITISKGTYVLSNAHLWFNSYNHYQKWINNLNKYNLKNLYIKGGKVKGTIKNDEKGILALNIPFNNGWSAKVDGKNQKLTKVNGVLTGLLLEPGNHNIELTFTTPGLIPGIIISIISLLILIL